MSSKYNPSDIEHKWQKKWASSKIYSPNLTRPTRPKGPFYNLMMFPYPSAEGMHVGSMFAFTGSDVYGRFKAMQGYDVFEPIGLDGFGIHSENYALKVGKSPQRHAAESEKNYYRQLYEIGNRFDWTKTVETYDPDYYRWTQWLFIKMFEAGLAYRKKAEVNWCPGCKTVLADEQIMTPAQAAKIPVGYKSMDEVPEGIRICERCGNIPEKKELEQWFFKITKYADRLLTDLKKINWSERVKIAQKNWIGKSKGMIIKFKTDDGELEVFTTRPDTLEGATFVALADDKLYNKYKDSKEKVGEFTGKYAINPRTLKKMPIWKTNYVAPGYGTGAIMGVPHNDERDMEFAKKYKLDIVKIKPNKNLWKEISKKGWGKLHINYHLRDWLVSRQRYWGPPIPMIYCEDCARLRKQGWQAVPEKDLPVLLPNIQDYTPEGTGHSPLAHHPEFYSVKCPNCGSDARRETDVMDTFVDSSWYFLRYPSVGSKTADKMPFDLDITRKWLPVDQYFGGAEHAVLHLLYARFVTKALYDLKLINFDEPFTNFYAHGLVIKDGAKMSKSRGNVINPDDYIKKFGSDTFRTYLMFMGPMDSYPDFRDTGIEGMQRFISRVWNLFTNPRKLDKTHKEVDIKMHQTIKKVTEDLEKFHYNTAISSLMEYVNTLRTHGASPENLKVLAQLIAPFAPHMAEEAWVAVLGQKYSVHNSIWPSYEPKMIQTDTVSIVVQVDGKVRSQLTVDTQTADKKSEIEKMARADNKTSKWLGKTRKQVVVFVPGKVINFVTK